MSDFREILKYLRNRSGLSQAELAKHMKISKSAISMYERGEREPSFELTERFADFFNVDMNFMLGKNEDKCSTYYIDSEAAEIAQEIFSRPELRALFDASRHLSPDQALSVAQLIEQMKRTNPDG